MTDEPALMSLQKVADLFGRGTVTIRNWIKLDASFPQPVWTRGRGLYFDRAAVAAYAARCTPATDLRTGRPYLKTPHPMRHSSVSLAAGKFDDRSL